MFVKHQINISTLATGTTATTINIPINMEFQIVDQADLIERVFVDVEVEKAINPILDYEKVRFLPVINGQYVDKLIYNITLSGGAVTYGDIGFSDDDIKFEKNNFKQTFVNLAFYDSPNSLNQILVSNITLFAHLTPTDLLPSSTTIGIPGQPKPASQIGLSFVLENPIINPRGFSEGYHLYDYKDELNIGDYKYLYMRASFKNSKTGRSINLMVQNTPATIDNLVNLLYTRFKLFRTTTGYYYQIDDSYHGNGSSGSNNVQYSSSNATINLYQIQAL